MSNFIILLRRKKKFSYDKSKFFAIFSKILSSQICCWKLLQNFFDVIIFLLSPVWWSDIWYLKYNFTTKLPGWEIIEKRNIFSLTVREFQRFRSLLSLKGSSGAEFCISNSEAHIFWVDIYPEFRSGLSMYSLPYNLTCSGLQKAW